MKKILYLLSFFPAILFPIGTWVIEVRNLSIFGIPNALKDSPILWIVFVLFMAISMWVSRNDSEKISRFVLFICFTLGYFFLASIFNTVEANTNNIYFAADNWSWYLRMAEENGWNVGTRAIHPYPYIIFRPLVSFISFISNVEPFYVLLSLLSITGAGCVWLTWNIIQKITGNSTCSNLFSTLLGFSASHLIFASVIESYIFSAFLLLAFVWFLMKEKPYWLLALTGVLTFGITFTNTIQQGLASLFIKKNLKQTLMLFAWIVVLGVILNYASHLLYPVTELLTQPENLTEDRRFLQEISLKRIGLMAENLFLYNIVAPQPYMAIRNGLPRFVFLSGSITEYIWFGFPALIGWMMFIVIAFFNFFQNFRDKGTENFLSFSLVASILFNFALQVGYGTELFLYSAGWTYAVILFVAINLRNLFKNVFFQWGVFFVVTLIFVNNLWFLYLIARKVSEYIT